MSQFYLVGVFLLLVGLVLGSIGTAMTHRCKPMTPLEVAEYAMKHGLSTSFIIKEGRPVHYALVTNILSDSVVFAWRELENGLLVDRELAVAMKDLEWVKL